MNKNPTCLASLIRTQRVRITLFFIILLGCSGGVFLCYQNSLHDKIFQQQYRTQLLQAAYGTAAIFGSEYHNNMRERSVSKQQELETIARLTAFKNNLGFSSLYSLVQKESDILLVAASKSEEEQQAGSINRLYASRPDASETLLQSFGATEPQLSSYEDHRGRVRTLFLPLKSGDGTAYLIGVEVLDKALTRQETAVLRTEHTAEILLFLLLAVIGLVFSLVFRKTQIMCEAHYSFVQKKDQQLRAILTNTDAAMFLKSTEGVYLQVNPAFAGLLDTTEDNCVGKNDRELFGSVMADQMLKADKAVLLTEAKQYDEICFEINGRERFFITSKVPVYDESANIYAICGIALEKTECRQMARELVQQKEEYQQLVENAASIILRMDKEGVITFINDYGRSFFGYSEEELVGHSVMDTIVPEQENSGRDLREMIGKLCDDPEKFENNDNENVCKNGDRVCVRWSNRAVSRNDEMEILCVGNDRTGQYYAEDKLRQLSQVVEQSSHTIIITDKKGNIEFVNPAFTQFSGYEYEEAIGQTPRMLKSDRHPQGVYKAMWNTISKGRVWQGEVINRRKDGALYWNSATISPIKDEKGEITHYCSLQEDITNRKIREEELRNSEQRLRILIEALPDGVFFKDGLGRFELVNQAGLKILSLENNDWQGKTDIELAEVNAECAEVFVECARTDEIAWEQKGLFHNEESFVDQENKLHLLDVTKIPLFTQNDERNAMVIVARDVTKSRQVENDLAESRRRVQFALQAADAGAFYYDKVADVLDWDQRSMELFGIEAETFGADFAAWVDCLLAEDYERVVPEVEEAIDKGSVFDIEFRVALADGAIRHIRGMGYAIVDEAGTTTALAGLHFDVSRRKEEEAARQAARKLTQAILDNVMTGITFLNGDRQLVQANHYLTVLFGYTVEEVLGQTTEKFYPSVQDYRKFGGLVYSSLARDEIFDGETIMRRKDGSLFHCHVRCRCLEPGDLSKGSIVSLEDVTERHNYEKKLRNYSEQLRTANRKLIASREQLDLALESANVGLWDWHPQTDEFYTNEVFLTMLGYAPDTSVLSSGKQWLSLVHSEDSDPTVKVLQPFIEGDDTLYESDQRIKTADGDWKWIHAAGRVVDRDKAGKALRFIGIHIDINENKLLQLELTTAKQKADAANQAKSIFLANMSHELRTPLNAILGFSQLLVEDDSLQGEQHKKIHTINRSGTYLLGLINDVLDLSKIDAGRLVVNPEEFDFHELLRDITEMFRFAIEKKGLRFSVELSDQLPRYIKSDPKKMRQVLTNLLGNALKFTDKGSVILRVRMTDSSDGADPDQLYLEVEDTGPGMSSLEQEKLFQPFVQTRAGVEKDEGTGLGLAISRSFARLFGGDITVTTRLGKGSRFRFHLPIQLVNKNSAAPPLRRVSCLAPGQPRYRILISDKHAESLALMNEWLQTAGFTVRTVTNGSEAVEIWRQWQPHLIWMDMRMPAMDGYAATKFIKAEPGGRETIIIALSADAFIQNQEAMLAIGCDDFVAKPCDSQTILAVMKKHLNVQYLYEEATEQENNIDAPGLQAESVSLEGLSPEILEQLRRAVTLGDTKLMNETLAIIQRYDNPLAAILQQWAAAYEYERILQLMR